MLALPVSTLGAGPGCAGACACVAPLPSLHRGRRLAPPVPANRQPDRLDRGQLERWAESSCLTLREVLFRAGGSGRAPRQGLARTRPGLHGSHPAHAAARRPRARRRNADDASRRSRGRGRGARRGSRRGGRGGPGVLVVIVVAHRAPPFSCASRKSRHPATSAHTSWSGCRAQHGSSGCPVRPQQWQAGASAVTIVLASI